MSLFLHKFIVFKYYSHLENDGFQQIKNIISCFKTTNALLFIEGSSLTYMQAQFINS